MTEPKWLIGITSLFLALSIVLGVVEQSTYLPGDAPGLFQTLLAPPSVAMLMNPGILWDKIVALWRIFWFDYSFFQGGWKIVQYFFQCISIALIVSYGAAIMHSLISAGAAIIGRIAGSLRGAG